MLGIQIHLAANTASFNRDLVQAGKRVKKTSQEIENNLGKAAQNAQRQFDNINNSVSRFNSVAGKFASIAAKMTAITAAATSAATGIGAIVRVQREFDVLNASLVTATGSAEAAASAMGQIKEFAKSTPYGLAQATEGFVKLKNLGLIPSIDSLTSFGNTASAMGKDLMQMIEAVADASTFEFERLKEFGIKAKQEKNEVSFTFQGVTTTVAKNAKDIEQYLLNLGSVQFAGAMAKQMDTLNGAMSAFQDSWDNLILTVANYKIGNISITDMLKNSITAASQAIDWAADNIHVVLTALAAAMIGLSRTAIVSAATTSAAWVGAMARQAAASIASAYSLTAYQTAVSRTMLVVSGLGVAVLGGGVAALEKLSATTTRCTAAIGSFGSYLANTAQAVRTYTAQTLTLANAKTVVASAISRAGAAVLGFGSATKSAIANGMAYTRSLFTINGAKSAITATARLAIGGVAGFAAALRSATVASLGYTRSLVTATAAKRAFVGTATLAARSVGAIGSAFKSLAGLIARHPLMIIGGIIAAIVVRTMGLQKAMDSLSDAIKIVGLMLGDLVDAGINAFMGLYNAASNFLSGFLGKSEQTTEAVNTAFGGLFANTKGGFVGVLQVVARIFDRMVNAGISAVNGLYRAFVRLWNGLKQGFAAAFGAVTSAVANGINAVLDTVDGAISGVNKMIATAAEAARGFGLDVKTPQINKIGYRANGMVINVSKTAETDLISARSNLEATVLAYADQVAKTNKANADLGKAAAATTTANNDAAKSAKGKANADKKGANAAKERSKQDNAAATAAKKLAESYNSAIDGLKKQLWELGNNPLGLETGKVEYELTQGELRGLNAAKAENALKLANFVDQASIKSELERNAFEAKLALLDTDFEKFFTRMYGGAGLDKLSSLGYEAGYNATTGNAQVVMTEAGKQERFNALLEMATLEADKLSKSYADNNRELNNQLALLGVRDTYAKEMLQIEQSVNDELAKYRPMDKDNELGEQYSRIKEAAEQNAELQKQLATMTAYREITDNLVSDEQKRSTELMSQLDILNKQSQIAGKFDIKTAKQLIGNAIGSAKPASTPFDELIAKKNEADELLKQANDTLLANEKLTAEERINIEKWVADEQLKIKKAHNLAMGELVLAQAADTTAQLADGLKQSLGEQSKAYRAAFVLQQSFAIGSAVLNMHKAISDAFAEGTTFAQKLAGIAAATTQGMKIVSAIRQIQNPVIGQAHDGIMSVPKSGTWNLEKGERVLPKHTAKNLDKTLASMQGGGSTVNVSVTVNSSGGDVQADSQLGKRFGEAIKLAVQSELQKERRQGGLLYGR